MMLNYAEGLHVARQTGFEKKKQHAGCDGPSLCGGARGASLSACVAWCAGSSNLLGDGRCTA